MVFVDTRVRGAAAQSQVILLPVRPAAANLHSVHVYSGHHDQSDTHDSVHVVQEVLVSRDVVCVIGLKELEY